MKKMMATSYMTKHILEEVEHFYCNLYKQRETDGADFSSLNAQKLSQEDSDMIEQWKLLQHCAQ